MLGILTLIVVITFFGWISYHDEERSRKEIAKSRKYGVKPKDTWFKS